jgi:hypothetical protein
VSIVGLKKAAGESGFSPSWQAGLGSSGFHSDIAGGTVEGDAVLELILLEPGKAGCVLPKPIDIATGLVPRVELETARMGIPSLDWVKRILFKAQVSGEITNSPSALVDYARELAAWYKSVMMDAAMRLSKEIESSRTIQLRLQLLNSGTAPSQHPEIELLITPTLRITNSRPSGYWSSSSDRAPTLPADLGLPVPKTTEWPFISFYSEPAPTSNRDILKLETYVHTDLNEGQVSLKFRRASLQHGKAIDLSPIYIVFGKHPTEDLTVEYKLFSTN